MSQSPYPTGILELDRALGGGFFAGSWVTLVGGKSHLLLDSFIDRLPDSLLGPIFSYGDKSYAKGGDIAYLQKAKRDNQLVLMDAAHIKLMVTYYSDVILKVKPSQSSKTIEVEIVKNKQSPFMKARVTLDAQTFLPL